MSNVKTFTKSDGLYITDNFRVNEFACNDGTKTILIDYELACLLQFMRDLIGKPLIVNSGYRTASYNKKVGGASNSYHIKGRAFDISGADVTTMCNILNTIGVKGIIKYPTFVHMDSRDTKYHASNQGVLLTYGTYPIKYNWELLKYGMRNYKVGVLQFRLNRLGFNCGTVDGIFGRGTETALKKFQTKNKLVADGICGKNTFDKLFQVGGVVG